MWKKTKRTLAAAAVVCVIAIAFPAVAAEPDPQHEPGRFLVCLDPGHGGEDAGASYNGVEEKAPNLDIALRARELLRKMGYRVMMTRETDVYISLEDRCRMANDAGASLFMSIHNNAYMTDSSGTETYAYYDSWDGKKLATYVHEEVVKRLGRTDRGVKEAGFYVLKNTNMTSALVEGLFLTNPEEAKLLLDPAVRQKIADGVAAGIDDYLRDPGLFDTYLLVMNPDPELEAEVEYSFMGGDGKVDTLEQTIEPLGRRSVHIDEYVCNNDVSTLVESTNGVGIVAERSMYFSFENGCGGHCAPGVEAPATDWYFAEGSTDWGYSTYILVQNPSDENIKVDMWFTTSTGGVAYQCFSLAPHSRFTLNCAGVEGMAGKDFSTRVHSGQPIIAERAMYWQKGGASGGHDSPGITAPGTVWHCAEGTTRPGFDTYILLGNPGQEPAHAMISYMLLGGGTVQQPVMIGAHSRQSVHLNEVKGLENTDASAMVESDVPIMVERSVYFDYKGIKEGTSSPGVPEPRTTWNLAEGCTSNGYDTFILLENPGELNATATLTFLLSDGRKGEVKVGVGAHSRSSLHADEITGLEAASFATVIESDQPIVAERAMYFNIGVKSGGHSSSGVPAAALRWYFAEGCTR